MQNTKKVATFHCFQRTRGRLSIVHICKGKYWTFSVRWKMCDSYISHIHMPSLERWRIPMNLQDKRTSWFTRADPTYVTLLRTTKMSGFEPNFMNFIVASPVSPALWCASLCSPFLSWCTSKEGALPSPRESFPSVFLGLPYTHPSRAWKSFFLLYNRYNRCNIAQVDLLLLLHCAMNLITWVKVVVSSKTDLWLPSD